MSDTSSSFSTVNFLLAIAGIWLVFNFHTIWAWTATLGVWAGLAKILVAVLTIIGVINIVLAVIAVLLLLIGLAIFVASVVSG